MDAQQRLDRATDPFFFEELSPAAVAVITANAVRIRAELDAHAAWAALNCDLAAAKWLAAFSAAGVAAEVRGGQYDPNHVDGIEHPGSSDHTWLRVEGRIFDPTAGQFSSPIDPAAYFDNALPHPHAC